MKEDLEKYLKKKRLKLDVEEPEQDLIWEGIRNGLQDKKRGLPDWFWKVAAIFIFAVSATYFVVNETKEDKVVVVTLADISDELGNQEAELKHLVDLKWEEIEPLLPEENSDIKFLLDEMNELDEVYKTYQNDLSTDANEEIITALLDYYQKKMRILNRLLHEIQKQDNHEETIML